MDESDVSVEIFRAQAISLDVLAEHCVRIEAAYAKYRIRSARQGFNLDESGD